MGQVQDNLTKEVFKNFIRKNETVEFIAKVRGFLGIPNEGYSFTEEHRKDFNKTIIKTFYIPNVKLSIKDKDTLEQIKKGKSVKIGLITTFRGFVKHTCSIESDYIISNLILYTFFNTYIEDLAHENDFVRIEDLNDTLKEYDYGNKINYKGFYEWINFLTDKQPVAILINPNLSKSRFKKYIDQNWEIISKYSKGYSNSGLKIRKKKNISINDYVYKNKDKKISEIRSLLAKMNIFLDDGHISKIKNLEIKRRK